MKDLDKLWVGLVEDNKDPDHLGRVKVRVQSIYDNIPIEDIPWATPIKTLSARGFECPAIGKMVSVFFPNDNLYEPYFMYADHYNTNLQKKLKDLSDDEYVNFVSLLFDHRTKIYSDDTELTMDYKYNKMTITNDDINLELKDNQRKVNIGCQSASQQAVLGNHWMDWMDKFVNELLKPSSLIGNQGSSILKPNLERILMEYKKIRETFLSDHVYIVDDNKVDKLEMKYNAPYLDDGIKINNDPITAGNDLTSQTLKDNVKDQKDKALEEIKEAIPSDVISNENVMEVKVDSSIPAETIIDYTELYKKVNNGNETIITKPEYDKIKNKEMQDAGLDVYDAVEDPQDADDIISNMEFEIGVDTEASDTDETITNYDPNSPNIYITDNNDKYVDKSTKPNPGSNTKTQTGKNISKNITYQQATKTSVNVDNTPDNTQLEYMRQLANNIFEPILTVYGGSIGINSFFRGPKVNTAVGGSSTSQHSKGQAFDLKGSKGNKKLFNDIITHMGGSKPQFDQLIWEFGTDNEPAWVHVSHKSAGNRGEVLMAKKEGGNTKYVSIPMQTRS